MITLRNILINKDEKMRSKFYRNKDGIIFRSKEEAEAEEEWVKKINAEYIMAIWYGKPKNTRDFLPIEHLGPGALILFDKAIKKLLEDENKN